MTAWLEQRQHASYYLLFVPMSKQITLQKNDVERAKIWQIGVEVDPHETDAAAQFARDEETAFLRADALEAILQIAFGRSSSRSSA